MDIYFHFSHASPLFPSHPSSNRLTYQGRQPREIQTPRYQLFSAVRQHQYDYTMTNNRNMSGREYEQSRRRNDRDDSPHTRFSGYANGHDSDLDNADYGFHLGPGHNGNRRGAVDLGVVPRGERTRPGAIDFGRGPHDDLEISRNKDDEDSEGFLRVRRGSAAGRDGSRGFERRPVNSRFDEDLKSGLPARGEEYLPSGEEIYGRLQRPTRRSGHVSHDARVDGEDDFEPRDLRRADPLTRDGARGTEDRAQYVYYEPHGPCREGGPRSTRR